MAVCTKVWLEVHGTFAIGAGGIELLRNVAQHGSLAEAARRVGWSYRHAWGYVRRSERVLGVSLLEARPGKGSHRGSALSAAAITLVTKFERIAEAQRTAAGGIR